MENIIKYLENLINKGEYQKALAHIDEITSDPECFFFPDEYKTLIDLADKCK